MPIEIKELHIRVSVDVPVPEGVSPAGGPSGPAGDTDERAAIVAECVEQVMQVLRDEKER